MTDDASTPSSDAATGSAKAGSADAGGGAQRWVRRIVLAVVLLIATYIAWRISAAFFPRWWAQRIGN